MHEKSEGRLFTAPPIQGLVPARVSGFESPLRHQLRRDDREDGLIPSGTRQNRTPTVNPGMTSAPVARSVSRLVKLRRSVPVTLIWLFSL